MKNYLVGSNSYSILLSYLLDNIKVVKTDKFNANDISPKYLPDNDLIINFILSLRLKPEIKTFNVFFDDRGNISTKSTDTFENVYALTTRGKTSIEKRYFKNYNSLSTYNLDRIIEQLFNYR